MYIRYKKSFSIQDVRIAPRVYSDLLSRTDVDLTTNINNKTNLKIPIIGSPMDTVCNSEMAIALAKAGAVGIMHRFQTIEEQAFHLKFTIQQMKYASDVPFVSNVGVAIGVNGDYQERLTELIRVYKELEVSEYVKLWVCFDTANGFNVYTKNAIEWYKSNFQEEDKYIITIAGNVASKEGYLFLDELEIDCCRLNIGTGSNCITTSVAGIGIPNGTLLDEVNEVKNSTLVIMDGGIKSSGDIVKSLAIGADLCMLGGLLAGYDESPGEIIQESNGKSYKQFRGMASREANNKLFELNNSHQLKTVEGISTMVEYKGPVDVFLFEFVNGIKSGFSYINAHNINEFHEYFDSTKDSLFII